MERRRPEAGSLRALIQQQLDHLQRLFRARHIAQIRARRRDRQVCDIVESVIDGTDSRLRGIGDYQARLQQGAHRLTEQIGQVVRQLPAAVSLGRGDYLSEPLAGGLFASPKEIAMLFSNDREVRKLTRGMPDAYALHALLMARRREKQVLGSELRGDLLLREVRQTVVDFSGHRLCFPRWREQEVRDHVTRMLLDEAVEQIKLRLARARGESSRHSPESLYNPEVYLRRLAACMERADTLIRLERVQLRVSPMGVRLPLDSDRPSRLLDLRELVVGDRPPRVIALVRYPLEELNQW